MTDNREELTKTEARQGHTPHMARNVLRWGLVGAVAALVIVWIVVGM
jgi:hypothetical protein